MKLVCCALCIIALATSAPQSGLAVPEADHLPRFDAYLQTFTSAGDFSGVALVARGDDVLFHRAYGYADAAAGERNGVGHAFRVASLSKTFTGAAIGILAEKGLLSVSDPLSKFLPEFPNASNITLEQLLRHTSGVGQLDSAEASQSCLAVGKLTERIAAVTPASAPGKEESYSNEGYVLLAAVIEKLSGQSYGAFLDAQIFKPLGMSRSGTMCQQWPIAPHANGYIAGLPNGASALIPHQEPAWDGAASVYSTTTDMLTWLRAVEGDRLFPHARYPFGWGRRNYSGRPLIEQSGQLEGYTSHISLYAKDHIYFVVLSNIESGMFGRLPKDFEALMFGVGEPSSPPVVVEAADPGRSLADFAGEYRNAEISIPLRVELRAGRLWMRWGEFGTGRPLIRTGPDEFSERAEYGQVRFTRDAAGSVVSSAWTWGDSPLVMTRQR